MLKTTLELFKVNMINSMKLNDKKKKKTGPLFLGLFLVALFIVFLTYSFMFCQFLHENKITYLIFPAFVGMGMIIMLMITTYKARGALFGFKDADLLFSMPIPESSILSYKILNMMLFNYIVSFLTVVPTSISYALFEPTNGLYIPFVFLTFLLTPLIPTLISGLFGYVIGYLSSKSKHRSIIETFASLIIVFVFILLTTKIEVALEYLLNTETNLETFAQRIFYPLWWVQDALVNGNIVNMLLFAATSIISFVVFVLVLNHLFIKINKKLKEKFSSKNFTMIDLKTEKPVIAMFKKEFSLYTKSSIYMLNTCFGSVAMLLFAISSFFFDVSIIGDTIFDLSKIHITNFQILTIICGIMAPLSCTTPDAISMESKGLWVCREMPIKEMDIFLSKMMVDMCLILPINIIAMFLLSISFGLAPIEILALFVLVLFVGLTMTQFGLLLNLKYPKLKFQSEAEVIKESLSASLAVYIPLAIAFVLGLIYAIIRIDFIAYIWALCILFIVLCVVCHFVLKTYGVRKFRNLYC